ncbi:hypothetical protein [Streptomyces sp. BE133]|uniref:hypothetical protein n=1 Tax=Streptomyces sp. BE133 TaxID=3002523 RepID=UPI002E78B1C9|nr:hypothetical protein [Streptomyces sp. BE133]MEE1807333.1 hypothetical protein [Streptomyces sp. BE133]
MLPHLIENDDCPSHGPGHHVHWIHAKKCHQEPGQAPDPKQKLQSGQESAALFRQVGEKKADEQEAHLQRLKEKQAEEAAEKKARAAEKRARGDRQTPASQGQGGRRAEEFA